jgi:hypothetical protein
MEHATSAQAYFKGRRRPDNLIDLTILIEISVQPVRDDTWIDIRYENFDTITDIFCVNGPIVRSARDEGQDKTEENENG